MPDVADISLRKLPRYNEEADQYVLGACFGSGDAFARALEIIELDDFYKTGHRKIFSAMQFLFEANQPIDILTVADRLRKSDELDNVGAMDYLDFLEGLVPTSAAISHHSKIIREKKVLRDLIETATEIVASSYEDSDDADEILDKAERSIFRISEKRTKRSFFSIKEIIKSSFDSIEKLFEKPGMVTGVETGFRELDQLTSGLQPSDLIIISGRPSMGKTSLALDIARFAACKRKVPTAIFSLEMSKEQLGLRMLCSEARVSSVKLRTGFLASSDWPNLTAAAGRISEAPIFIDDSPQLGTLDIRARSRRLKAEHSLGLIIVDYLQLMHGSNKIESRQLEISEISRGLKGLAKELNVPILALSQLSRAVESRTDKRPLLSDLRESGSIEQDADVVAFIYRDEVYDPKSAKVGIAEILVRKQRNGPIGEVELVFLKEFTRFENLAHHEAELEPTPAEL
ncbi:MAG: replicative DNA helicase [Nitrospinae bacterium]|nr:replicative DNA helicase [Nitrospinota bacterium]